MNKISNLINSVSQIFDRFDRWLCESLPGPLRFRWARLWIRKDEFHPSLDSDADYFLCLPREKQENYWLNLIKRRNIAHKRDTSLI
jgi:hypothetical protein